MAGLFAQVRGQPKLISILLVAADLEAGLQHLLSSPQLARLAADAAVGRPPAPSHAPAPSGQRLQRLPQELQGWIEGNGLMRLHAAAMKVGVPCLGLEMRACEAAHCCNEAWRLCIAIEGARRVERCAGLMRLPITAAMRWVCLVVCIGGSDMCCCPAVEGRQRELVRLPATAVGRCPCGVANWASGCLLQPST